MNGATTNLSTLGWDGVQADLAAVFSNPANSSYIGGTAGTLANQDYINVLGTLNLNSTGVINVTDYNGFSSAAGDVYNLFDWGALVPNGFNVTTHLQLPTLTGGLN